MNRKVIISLGALVLIILLFVGLWIWPGQQISSPWRAVHHPFDPKRCEAGECEEMIRLPMVGTQGLSIMVDPAADDEVAQWSDCLASIAQCVDKKTPFAMENLRDCVVHSVCPQSCREGFDYKVRDVMDTQELVDIFDEYFVKEGGQCVPQ